MVYDQCSEELREAFVEKHGEPILYKEGVGRFDENRQLLQEFTCKYDCIKQMKMSDKTMTKILDKDVMYNQCYYQSLGAKPRLPWETKVSPIPSGPHPLVNFS